MPKLVRCTGQLGTYWKPASEQDAMGLLGMTELVVSGRKTRTPKMNAALHQWLGELADALNSAGLDMKRVLKAEVDILWDKDSAKEYLWRPLQQAMTGKESTTEPTTTEYIAVQETLIRHLSTKFGIAVEWPSIDRMMRESA